MPKCFALRLAPFLLAGMVTACSGSDSPSDAGPGPSPIPTTPAPTPPPTPAPAPSPSACSPTVTGLPASIPADAARYPFSIAIGSSCDWTARSDAAWASIAPGSGRGNAELTLTVEQNTRSDDSRTAVVSVNGSPYRVLQNRVNCAYTLDRTSLDQGPGGGNVRIALTTRDTCAWTATASESWIRVITPSGTGSAAVSVDLEYNSSSADRRGYLTIAGVRVDVLQRRNDL